MSALFAYLHTLSMIALGAMLFAMMLTFDLLQEPKGFHRFWVLSWGVATAAAVALASGIVLVIWTDHGSAFYLHNPVFYIKLAGFVAMLLIAVTPARLIIQWHQDATTGDATSGDIETGASGTGAIADTSLVPLVQRYVVFELLLLLVIPLAASLAARGIGTQLSAS
jgi:putative membrane protein